MVVHDMGINALGRAYSLSLLAAELGWEFRVSGRTSTGHLWPVLENSDFASSCRTVGEASQLTELANWATVLVGIKALPGSFGVALGLAHDHRKPLLLDIDDPDLEQHAARVRSSQGRLKGRHELRRSRALRKMAMRQEKIVSNPVLQRAWGGIVVPHVRVSGLSREHHGVDRGLNVAFVGTARPHKGIDVLRSAVAELSADGYSLTVTDEAPTDAKPWETWTGAITFNTGIALAAKADIIAIPSLAEGYAPSQLPVKLIDAMMAGAAIVASDLEPIRWALDGTGLLCRPGSVRGLIASLEEFRSTERRAELGASARARAQATFTPPTVAPRLASAVEGLMDHQSTTR